MDMVRSIDVEALYPSLEIAFKIEKVCGQLHDSTRKFSGINHKELGLYFSLVKMDEELRDMGPHNAYLKRRDRRGPDQNSPDAERKRRKRTNTSRINEATKRRMLTIRLTERSPHKRVREHHQTTNERRSDLS